MSWAGAERLIAEHGLNRSEFPLEDQEPDGFSVAVPVGEPFDLWLWIMNTELQAERWAVPSMTILFDSHIGQPVVVALCHRFTAEQLRAMATGIPGGLVVPQPAAPPNLRTV